MAAEERQILFTLKINTGGTEQELKKMTEATEKQEQAIKKTTEAIKAEEGSITAIRQKNKELTAERNATTASTEAGRLKINALNAELDKNNKVIRDNVDAYTKQKIGIGDYTGALDKLVPGLGATINGIKGMTAAGLTFIATPVGLVIAAIGVALGALIAYFKGSEEGQNRLNKIMAVGSAIMEKVMDIVENLGEAIFNAFANPKQALVDLFEFIKNNLINRVTALVVIFEGLKNLDFKQVANGVIQLGTGVENAIDKISDAVTQTIKNVDAGIQAALRMADLQAAIDVRERDLLVSRAKTTLDVAKLKEDALKLEGAAKRAAIQEAVDLEKMQIAEEVKLEKARLLMAIERGKLNGLDKEALKEIAEARARVYNAEAAAFENTLKLNKQLAGLDEDQAKKDQEAADKKLAAIQKEKDAEANLNEFLLENRAKNTEDESKRVDLEIQLEQDRMFRKLDNENLIEEEKQLIIEQSQVKINEIIDASNARILVKAKKDADAKKKIEEESAESRRNIAKFTEQFTSGLFKKQSLAYKAAKIGETIIATYESATAAYASAAKIPYVGFILGPIAAGLAIASGLKSVAAISGVKLGFAKGGMVPLSGTRITAGMGIPTRRDNGDNLLATVKTGEVILNEKHQAMLGGDKTFARIGVPGFADSGLVQDTRVAANQAQSQQLLVDIANSIINQPRTVLVLQDFEAKQGEVDNVLNKAQII